MAHKNRTYDIFFGVSAIYATFILIVLLVSVWSKPDLGGLLGIFTQWILLVVATGVMLIASLGYLLLTSWYSSNSDDIVMFRYNRSWLYMKSAVAYAIAFSTTIVLWLDHYDGGSSFTTGGGSGAFEVSFGSTAQVAAYIRTWANLYFIIVVVGFVLYMHAQEYLNGMVIVMKKGLSMGSRSRSK